MPERKEGGLTAKEKDLEEQQKRDRNERVKETLIETTRTSKITTSTPKNCSITE